MTGLNIRGVEMQFNDFSEEVQEKLYLQDKMQFEADVAKSQYCNIRRLLNFSERKKL